MSRATVKPPGEVIEVHPSQLKQAVEGLHRCKADLREVVEIHETFKGATVWHGLVHVFDLDGHPKAAVAYAWSAPVEGSERRKFYAVLGVPPVVSAETAIRAAIVNDHRATHA